MAEPVRASSCPPWCKIRRLHDGHEGDVSFGRAAVTVYKRGDQPAELQVWDQTETPYRAVELDQDGALILARVLSALDPADLPRFAKALVDGAAVLEQGVEASP